jgi:hypothetical protein
MTPMTFHPLREWLRKRPFQSFRLVMASGQAFEVHSQDMAFLTQKETLIGFEVAGDGIPDRVKVCPLCNVEAVEPIDDRPPYP